MNTDTTILLVAHGSRGRDGNKETIHFAAQWRERHPGWRIEVCFIEHAEILLEEGLDRAAQGARTVVAIPFINGPHFVGTLHHDPSVLVGPTRHGLVSLSQTMLWSM